MAGSETHGTTPRMAARRLDRRPVKSEALFHWGIRLHAGSRALRWGCITLPMGGVTP